MSSECNHPYDLTNNYEGVCFGCNRHLSDIVAELEAENKALREAAQAVVRTWPLTTDTEIDGLAALLEEGK